MDSKLRSNFKCIVQVFLTDITVILEPMEYGTYAEHI
jgi:hypothetical protein